MARLDIESYPADQSGYATLLLVQLNDPFEDRLTFQSKTVVTEMTHLHQAGRALLIYYIQTAMFSDLLTRLETKRDELDNGDLDSDSKSGVLSREAHYRIFDWTAFLLANQLARHNDSDSFVLSPTQSFRILKNSGLIDTVNTRRELPDGLIAQRPNDSNLLRITGLYRYVENENNWPEYEVANLGRQKERLQSQQVILKRNQRITIGSNSNPIRQIEFDPDLALRYMIPKRYTPILPECDIYPLTDGQLMYFNRRLVDLIIANQTVHS